MTALRLDFEAALATAVKKKVFLAFEALASRVAHLLALVSAAELRFADLAAVWSALVAENVGHELLTAVAKPRYRLETRRTVARVAEHRAGMLTWQFLLARAFARGERHATLDGRVKLGNAARAEEWLSRDVLAGGAEADVAEFCALVLPTGELLVADDHAEVSAFAVRVLTPHGTAHLLAVVLLTLLHLVAHSLAF